MHNRFLKNHSILCGRIFEEGKYFVEFITLTNLIKSK